MLKYLLILLLVVLWLVNTTFMTVIAEEPLDEFSSQGYLKKGMEAYNSGHYSEAVEKFQQAYVLDSKNALYLYYIAKSYEKMNNTANAGYYYKKAVNKDKDMVSAWYNLGLLHAEQKRYNEAADFFERAVKIDKKFGYAYYNLGNVFLAQNKYQAAIDNYLNAIKCNKDYAPAYYNLACIYKEIGKKEDALKYYEKYQSIEKEDQAVKKVINSL